VCACCSAHGFNFGPGAGVNGDTVRRQLLLRQTTSNGAPVPGATFSADRAIPVSWDHGEVVVVTDLRYGEAKVVITAVDGRGRVVTQESPVSQFLDFSPSLRTAPGQATTQFSTGGGQVRGLLCTVLSIGDVGCLLVNAECVHRARGFCCIVKTVGGLSLGHGDVTAAGCRHT
jgi:hypothetical protein